MAFPPSDGNLMSKSLNAVICFVSFVARSHENRFIRPSRSEMKYTLLSGPHIGQMSCEGLLVRFSVAPVLKS